MNFKFKGLISNIHCLELFVIVVLLLQCLWIIPIEVTYKSLRSSGIELAPRDYV